MYGTQKSRIAFSLQQQIAPRGRAVFPKIVEQAVMEAVKPQSIQLIDGTCVELGAYWDASESESLRRHKLNALNRVVREMSMSYRTHHDTDYDPTHTLGYAVNYLPKNFPKVQMILLDLYRKDLLPHQFRILDIGTGVGTVPLAVFHFLKLLQAASENCKLTLPNPRFSCTGIDISAGNLEMFGSIADHLCASREFVSVIKRICVRVDSSGEWLAALGAEQQYDLIFFSNFFAELIPTPPNEKAAIVAQAATKLEQCGKLIIIEPADEDGALEYQALRVELLKQGFYDLCPCSSMALEAQCERCWTFRGECLQASEIVPSVAQKRLSGGIAADEDVKWCYGVFGLNRPDVQALLMPLRGLNLSGHRIADLQVRIVSSGTPYYKLCGAENDSQIALLIPQANRKLPPLYFGEVVRFQNLYIREPSTSQTLPHEYRLVYDSESTVSRNLIWESL